MHALRVVSILYRKRQETRGGGWLCLPSGEVPDPDVAVAAAADENVLPGDHGPDAHDVALKSTQAVALSIEDMDLGIVESDNDVLGSEVEAGNHTALLSDVLRDAGAAVPPGGLDEVALLEVRLVRLDLRALGDGSDLGKGQSALEAGRADSLAGIDGGRGGNVVALIAANFGDGGRGLGSRDGLDRLGSGPVVVVLDAQVLPSDVVREEVLPTLRYLRRASEDLGIVDEREDLEAKSISARGPE
jgi:hypothetical protein